MRREWDHTLVNTPQMLYQMVDQLSKRSYVGFDIETTGLAWWREARTLGLGFGFIVGDCVKTWYVPINHDDKKGNLPVGFTYEQVRPILSSESIRKIGANIKFDAHFMRMAGNEINSLDDIQIMARLCRSEWERVALDILVEKEFGTTHKEWEILMAYCKKMKLGVTKSYVPPGAYAKVPQEILGEYCGRDVYWTLLLAERYMTMLKKDPKLLKLYNTVERPLLNAIIDMEETGIKIDVKYLQGLQKDLRQRVESLEAQIYDQAGREFNIKSSKDLKEILPKLGVKMENRRRKKGLETTTTPSLDKNVLKKHSKIKLVKSILDFREASTLLATFVDGMLERTEGMKVPVIHASIRQESARTGRLGCTDPNLMNIPREDENDELRKASSIRHAILPHDSESCLLSPDYSQIEYRLLAHFARDGTLCDLFAKGVDFHTYVTSQLFDISIEAAAKDKAKRYIGKKFNFAQLYGAGLEHLAEQCGISIDKTRELTELYAKRFPTVKKFKQQVYDACVRNGGVRNVFGRFRSIPSDLAYRAVNTLIQGTAADILKIAILRLHKFFKGKQTKILFPVHDEIVMNYVPSDGQIFGDVIRLMTTFTANGAPIFRVPMEVEISVGEKNWGDKKKLDIAHITGADLAKEERDEGLREVSRQVAYKKGW